VKLDDPAVVREEYATEERLLQRRLDHWGIFEGAGPQAVELAADRSVDAFSVQRTRPLPLAVRSFPLRATCRNSIFIAEK
jgi:hypothetical protein